MTTPVRRRSSFQLFKAEQVPAFLENNPHVKGSDFTLLSKEMSKLWSALDLKEKDRYKKLAAAQTTQNECAMPMSEIKSARTKRSRSPRLAPRRIGPSPGARGCFPLECGHMTNDLRENCKPCLQHYQKREWLREGVDPAVESDHSQRPSDLTTAPSTDTLEAAGESQVILARAEESQAEESQAFV